MGVQVRFLSPAICTLAVVAWSHWASAQVDAYIPPPRTVADITSILRETPKDRDRFAEQQKLRQVANSELPSEMIDGPSVARFHYERCRARRALGRDQDAIADCERSIQFGEDFEKIEYPRRLTLSSLYRAIGELKKSTEIEEDTLRRFEEAGRGGLSFSINATLVRNYIAMGDFARAERYVARNAALLEDSRRWRSRNNAPNWEAHVARSRAALHHARGEYRDAELNYDRAITFSREWLKSPFRTGGESAIQSRIISLTALNGETKTLQGRLAEGESDIRRALLEQIHRYGKYNFDTALLTRRFAAALVEQARFAEAEDVAKVAIEIFSEINRLDADAGAFAMHVLGGAIFSQGRWHEAKQIFDKIDHLTRGWDASRRQSIRARYSRAFNNYYLGDVTVGLEAARTLFDFRRSRFGDHHIESRIAQGVLASGYVFAGRDAEAFTAFETVTPSLLQAERQDDDLSRAVARDQEIFNISEAYLTLLARSPAVLASRWEEGFRLGERIRNRSVERAIAASSARGAARDAGLADLIRREQDIRLKIAAITDRLNLSMALSADEGFPSGLDIQSDELAKLRATQGSIRDDIERLFPEYHRRITPGSVSLESLRSALKPDETYLSFYFGRQNTFAWAISAGGDTAFVAIPISYNGFRQKIRELRRSLEPNATTIADVPEFNLKLSHELYSLLLKPTEHVWKSSKSLVVATNGDLGTVPLGILVTEPPSAVSELAPLFSGYRSALWLARTHAVTTMPSASALVTLRSLPPSSGNREPLIGFGDPYFNAQQAAQAASASNKVADLKGRSIELRVGSQTGNKNSAQLASLPRLADTGSELTSIAYSLQADPDSSLRLGTQANESVVKSIDLSKYRIVAFATHALVAGELDGLDQPALALTSPDVAGVPGDGLLTMDEILGLRLNADWVILSACNTAAADGAGVEAASGLARAFFFAGTKSVLVTNWSVHSASAVEIVTEMFARQAADQTISRGEALRQSTIAMLDSGGFRDASGQMLFSYAHPLFWAPYSIVGDGG